MKYLLRLAVFCSLLIGSLSGWAASPIVLVVGDSLSAAYGLPEKAGWVNLLRERLAGRAPYYTVVNASISGDTTRGGAGRIAAALKRHRPAIVIIELGGNDALRGLPVSGTRNNLESMVNAVRQAQAQPLIVGVEIPPNYGSVYTRQFNQVYQDVARRYQVPLVTSLLAGFGERREMFQPDGIHPIASAQPLMLETVWKQLAPLLKITEQASAKTK